MSSLSPHSISFFLCPNKSFPMRCLYHVTHEVAFILHPGMSLPLWSPKGESSPCHFLCMSWQVPPSAVLRSWVTLTPSLFSGSSNPRSPSCSGVSTLCQVLLCGGLCACSLPCHVPHPSMPQVLQWWLLSPTSRPDASSGTVVCHALNGLMWANYSNILYIQQAHVRACT